MPATESQNVQHCTQCDKPLDSAVCCSSCHLLFTPDGCNAFEVFGLPVQYEIDAAALRQTYLELSRITHPDRYAAAPPEQQQLAMRVSARLNEAYLVLHESVSRAEYLLRVCGGKTAAEDKTVPPDVLMETLELREEIDEAKAAADPAKLGELRTQIESQRAEWAAKIDQHASELPDGDAELAALREALNAIKYYDRMLEQFET